MNDKACYTIFQSLFRFAHIEISAYGKSSKTTSKVPSASRLSTCASILRSAVDTLLRNLRTKSVRAVIEHITETLSTPGEGLWDLLGIDYMKCLAVLLQYPPHVEHLGVTEWKHIIDFCLRSLSLRKSNDSHLRVRNINRSASDDGNMSSGRSTPSRIASQPATWRDESVFDEVITCIKLLTICPNSPVELGAEKILNGLVEYVQSSNSGSAQRDSFVSINAVVSKVLFDQSDLVRGLLLDLLSTIRRLWNTKFGGLKDEMLSTITLCMSVLIDTARREPSEPVSNSVERLLDTLYSEYTRRSEKDVLQLDECSFFLKVDRTMNTSVLGPRLGNTRSEHNWTVVWAISILVLLSEEVAGKPSDLRDADEESRKRRRFTSKVDDIFRDSFSSSGMKRVCSLQFIPLLINGNIDFESKVLLFRRLIPSLLDDSGMISSWTMIAISRWVVSSRGRRAAN